MNDLIGEPRPSWSNLSMLKESLKPAEIQKKCLRERKVLFTIVIMLGTNSIIRMRIEVGEKKEARAVQG